MTFLLETIATEESLSTEWKRLFDHLRVNSLLDYWLSPQYHDAAKAELGKVDWSQQPRSVIRTSPPVTSKVSFPAITDAKVLLPLPLGPIIA